MALATTSELGLAQLGAMVLGSVGAAALPAVFPTYPALLSTSAAAGDRSTSVVAGAVVSSSILGSEKDA